jgi:hypothetical protein
VRYVSSPHAARIAAALVRGHRVYARGYQSMKRGNAVLRLHSSHRVRRGVYTLRLTYRFRHQRVTISKRIRVG